MNGSVSLSSVGGRRFERADKDGGCPFRLKLLITTHCVDLLIWFTPNIMKIWGCSQIRQKPYKQIGINEITLYSVWCSVDRHRLNTLFFHRGHDETQNQTLCRVGPPHLSTKGSPYALRFHMPCLSSSLHFKRQLTGRSWSTISPN